MMTNVIDRRSKNLFKNVSILGLGRGVFQAVGLALIPLYTFFLSPEEFGTLDLVLTYGLLIAPLVTIQVELGTFRFLVDDRESILAKRQTLSTTFVFVISISAAVTLVGFVLYATMQSGFVLQVSAYLASLMLVNYGLQVARGLGKMKAFAFASVVQALGLVTSVVIAVIIFETGVNGAIASSTVSNILGFLVILHTQRLGKMVQVGAWSSERFKELLGYSLPLVPNAAAIWMLNSFGRTVVFLMLGAAANGVYAASSRIAAIYSAAVSLFFLAWEETVASASSDRDGASFISRSFWHAVKLFFVLALAVTAAVPFVFDLLVGSEFAEAYDLIPPLMIMAFMTGISSLLGSIYVGLKKTPALLKTTAIAAGTVVLLSVALTLIGGLIGTALAGIIAATLLVVLRMREVKRLGIDLGMQVPTILIVLAGFGAILLTYYAKIAILDFAGLVIGGASLVWFIVPILSPRLKRLAKTNNQ